MKTEVTFEIVLCDDEDTIDDQLHSGYTTIEQAKRALKYYLDVYNRNTLPEDRCNMRIRKVTKEYI